MTGVSAVLLEKIPGRPAWSPATLKEVDQTDVIAKFFYQFSPENATAPSITLPEHLNLQLSKTSSPMEFSLPTEAEIKELITGSHTSSGGTTITQAELVQKLEALRRGKMGIREKVADVVSRRCIEESDNSSGAIWLKWRN